ncbi:hypothetical protein SLS60_009992 [Paraconiothyrium brasiliense]|uniref:Fibronectin type-III domain-containing protein n=1 Tax=Paraconiothyrium brasiliense TaxID=300254 RepID=A0ABR3QU58_9PLEO
MDFYSKRRWSINLFINIAISFTWAHPTTESSTALHKRAFGLGGNLGGLIESIKDTLKDDNAYDKNYDDTCILDIGTSAGGNCYGYISCGRQHTTTDPIEGWNECYLNGVNQLYYEKFGHFNVTFTQAGGVNSNKDGLHHPVISIEGFEGSLELEPLVDAYSDDGGNICHGWNQIIGTPDLGWECGFPMAGAHSFFGVSIIADDDPAPGFTPGWCTAHVNQYQRNEFRTGARYRFDIVMFDAAKKQIGHIQREEVDENGEIHFESRLPSTLILRSGQKDEDFVSFEYAGQTWSCDNDDGGAHLCTLGNGKEHGYENGDREGDMGWTCDSPPPPPTDTPAPKPGGKFLIVGDSITHGMDGDWTWRWRLYDWLRQNHDVVFAGPYIGTHGSQPNSVAYPSAPLFRGESEPVTEAVIGAYASGIPDNFYTQGHGGWWGRQAAQVRYSVHDWVASYQPDYLLILLGFNDLGWFVSGPDGLIGNMGALVQAAREAKSNVKVLVGNVVDRTFIEGRQDLVDNTKAYNQQLKTTLPNWFRYESPITYVDVNRYYNCGPGGCPDGYDGLHPNSRGEYHIAEAFADNLKADWGFVGDFSIPDNVDTRVVNTPRNLACKAVPEGNYCAWSADPQARGYEIRTRLQGQQDWWSSGVVYPSTSASFTSWVLDGQTWEYQVRTKGDNDDASSWTGSALVTAHPKTAPAPSKITSAPSGNGIQMNWDPVSGYDVNRYAVIVWDRDAKGSFINTIAAPCCGIFVDGLVSGHRYSTWAVTYVNMQSSWTGGAEIVGGLPGAGREVIINGGVPGPVGGLSVKNTDPTTIVLSWNGASGSVGGYAIYYHSKQSGGTPTEQTLVGTTMDTSYEVAFLYPGTWTYEFCVAAYNGNLESSTQCLTPPVYPGFSRKIAAGANSTTIANGTEVTGYSNNMANDTVLRQLFQAIHHNETALSMGAAMGATFAVAFEGNVSKP